LTHLTERLGIISQIFNNLVQQILQGYKIHNAEIVIRYDATVDDFIDVVLGNRIYLRCLYVYNKIDAATIEEIDKIARFYISIIIIIIKAAQLCRDKL
jgi:ribosome-interacting GTPase 1